MTLRQIKGLKENSIFFRFFIEVQGKYVHTYSLMRQPSAERRFFFAPMLALEYSGIWVLRY